MKPFVRFVLADQQDIDGREYIKPADGSFLEWTLASGMMFWPIVTPRDEDFIRSHMTMFELALDQYKTYHLLSRGAPVGNA